MKISTTIFAAIGVLLATACGPRISTQQQMAYDRAVQEARYVLNYPDASEWPPIEEAHFRQSGDTVSVTFTVQAANAFGTKSGEFVSLDVVTDGCARVVGGMLPGERGAIIVPDPPGMCDFYTALDWRRAYRDSIDAMLWGMSPEDREAYMDSSLTAMEARLP